MERDPLVRTRDGSTPLFLPSPVFIPGEQASQSPALVLRWPATVDGWAVERVVEREAAKFQCNQRYRCDPVCCLCRSCHRCEEAGPS